MKQAKKFYEFWNFLIGIPLISSLAGLGYFLIFILMGATSFISMILALYAVSIVTSMTNKILDKK